LDGFNKNLISEDKVWKLKPIIEQIFSRRYGMKINFKTLTIGDITIYCEVEEK